MELLRGPAANVSAMNRVASSGSGQSLSVSTTFITTFSIGQRQVRIIGDDPPVVNAGDQMVVTGEMDRTGVVEAICYVNVTRGAGHSQEGPLLWRAGGFVVLAMGVMGVGIALLYLGTCLLVDKLAPDDALLIAILTALGLPFYFVGRWMMRAVMTNRINDGLKAKMTRRQRIRAAREQAQEVFGTAEAAKEWLNNECPALGFVRPIDLLHDDEGLKNVTAILVRIEHGVFS